MLVGMRQTPCAPFNQTSVPVLILATILAACSDPSRSEDRASVLLLDAIQAEAVLALGDLAYEDGTAE